MICNDSRHLSIRHLLALSLAILVGFFGSKTKAQNAFDKIKNIPPHLLKDRAGEPRRPTKARPNRADTASPPEQRAQEAAAALESITADLLRHYVAQNKKLAPADSEDLRAALGTLEKYAKRFDKNQRAYYYLLDAFLSYWSDDNDKALEKAKQAYRTAPSNVDVADAVLIIARDSGDQDLVTRLLARKKRRPPGIQGILAESERLRKRGLYGGSEIISHHSVKRIDRSNVMGIVDGSTSGEGKPFMATFSRQSVQPTIVEKYPGLSGSMTSPDGATLLRITEADFRFDRLTCAPVARTNLFRLTVFATFIEAVQEEFVRRAIVDQNFGGWTSDTPVSRSGELIRCELVAGLSQADLIKFFFGADAPPENVKSAIAKTKKCVRILQRRMDILAEKTPRPKVSGHGRPLSPYGGRMRGKGSLASVTEELYGEQMRYAFYTALENGMLDLENPFVKKPRKARQASQPTSTNLLFSGGERTPTTFSEVTRHIRLVWELDRVQLRSRQNGISEYVIYGRLVNHELNIPAIALDKPDE